MILPRPRWHGRRIPCRPGPLRPPSLHAALILRATAAVVHPERCGDSRRRAPVRLVERRTGVVAGKATFVSYPEPISCSHPDARGWEQRCPSACAQRPPRRTPAGRPVRSGSPRPLRLRVGGCVASGQAPRPSPALVATFAPVGRYRSDSIVRELSENPHRLLPVQPLPWALRCGISWASLGAMGTGSLRAPNRTLEVGGSTPLGST